MIKEQNDQLSITATDSSENERLWSNGLRYVVFKRYYCHNTKQIDQNVDDNKVNYMYIGFWKEIPGIIAFCQKVPEEMRPQGIDVTILNKIVNVVKSKWQHNFEIILQRMSAQKDITREYEFTLFYMFSYYNTIMDKLTIEQENMSANIPSMKYWCQTDSTYR